MKVLAVFSILFAVALAADEYCFQDVVQACSPTNKKYTNALNCTAKYGAIDALQTDLQKLTNHHFIRSFEYLLMSTHFANYEMNRPGFEKLLRGLSDEKWGDAIELIKYITKRGGTMNFEAVPEDIVQEEAAERSFELNEFAAIARALDVEKKFEAEEEHIHLDASNRNRHLHDGEVSSHIENEFLKEERDIIRKLAGYSADLNSMLNGPDSSLALFLFDEYLQKQK